MTQNSGWEHRMASTGNFFLDSDATTQRIYSGDGGARTYRVRNFGPDLIEVVREGGGNDDVRPGTSMGAAANVLDGKLKSGGKAAGVSEEVFDASQRRAAVVAQTPNQALHRTRAQDPR
jgi:hypothetical protein